MSLSPLVSVITPTYNHEAFIAGAIRSLQNQTYANWEMVVVDDDSRDRTAHIIGECKDDRVRYLHQEHQGIEKLAHSYNRALSCCKGELIAILEGDDLWPESKLLSQISAFEDPSIILAYGAVGELSPDGQFSGRLSRTVRRQRSLPPALLSNRPLGTATRYMLRRNDLVPPSTVLIRRSALDAIGGFQYVPGLCVTDFPTFLRLSLVGAFHYSPQIMGYRRRHLGSVTLNNMDSIATGAYRHALAFIDNHQLDLQDAERTALYNTWKMALCSNEFGKGRLSLVRRHWPEARGHFGRSLNVHQFRFTAASMVGWLLSWMHSDLEWAMRLAGRATITP